MYIKERWRTEVDDAILAVLEHPVRKPSLRHLGARTKCSVSQKRVFLKINNSAK
ncbi:hypothetical protein BDW22DRAFT_1355928 [Trametopsis cervina]|nr:hypothetical protein BDW22DRAFT_1355928 [Trametopsis cervina]